jgi:glucose-1-phosphate adenylyltransferase
MARRSQNPKVLAIVLAGGEGKRLMPLTADRAKRPSRSEAPTG